MSYTTVNYFELYKEPLNMLIDKVALKKKYYALSRQYHPDAMQQASSPEAGMISEDVNKAHKVLSEHMARLRHLLEVMQWLPINDQYTLPSAFLMQSMELHEAIEEMQSNLQRGIDNSNPAVAYELNALEGDVVGGAHEVLSLAAVENCSPEQSSVLVEYYYKMKYIQRLKDAMR